MTSPDVKELVKALRAKAWQSSSRRNHAGGLSDNRSHVCWQASDLLEAQAQRIAELEAALEPFAHIASRFPEWDIFNEEAVLLIEEPQGIGVLTEIFARPFMRARSTKEKGG